jgi:hypothetical protein
MSDQTNTERKIIKQTNVARCWDGKSCPFCGDGDGANGDQLMLASATLGGRHIVLGVHRKCFDPIFAAQEAKRRAI